jgi:hypothetical protein
VITREQGLTTWANRWRTLKAWRRDLANVAITISDRSFPGRSGTCWPEQQRITIYVGRSFVDDLHTVLHELAHAAAMTPGHTETWQTISAAAVSEVTGLAVIPMAYNFRILDIATRDALTTWWRASGNERLWKLARGG